MKTECIEWELRKISGMTDRIRYSFEGNHKGLRGTKGLPGPGGPSYDSKEECLSEIDFIISDLHDIKNHLNGEFKPVPEKDLKGYVQFLHDGKIVKGVM